MGSYRPKQANPYVPDTVNRMKQSLADAISTELNRRNCSTTELRPYIPSIRKGHLNDFQQGVGSFYGISRLVAIAEALGLRPDIIIKGAAE